MRRVHLACASAAIGIAPMCFVDQLRAADRSWIDPGGGDFGTAGNWSPAVVPGSLDAAHFTLNDAYTVTFAASRTNHRMRLSQGTVTFNLGGTRTYALTSTGLPTDPSIAIGGGGFPIPRPGHLLINNGTVSGSSGFVGVGPAGLTSRIDNRLSVGAGGRLNMTGTLSAGFETDGVIDVTGGGDVNANVCAFGWLADARGGLSVSGGTSSFVTTTLFAGLAGHGTLNISGAGVATTTLGASIANGGSSSGAVTVTGAGSSWTNTGTMMTVGTAGAGSLTISDGALVTSGAPRIGDGSMATGNVLVTGIGSRWIATGSGAKIGNVGHGSLTIAGGGTAAFGQVEIGSEAGSVGSLNVSGNGSRWTGTNVSVGKTGTGHINVTAGGVAQSSSFVRLGGGIFTTGTGSGFMTVDGAGSLFNGQLYVEETSTLTVSNGGHVNLGFLESFGTVTLTGGTGSFGTVTSQFGGYGAGRINVSGGGGSFTAQSIKQSVLNIAGGGRATVRPDGTDAAVSVVQNLALGGSPGAWTGTLDLTNNDLIIDYDLASPLLNVADQIRSAYNGGAWNGAGGITSSSANANTFGLGYAESSSVFSTFPATFSGQTVDDTAVLIKFTRYGDANLDGNVNLSDFNELASNFGQVNRFWRQGDFNYDNTVNLQDFNRLAGNFGQSAGAEVTPQDWADLAAAVPEPAMGLAALAATTLVLRRRCRAPRDERLQRFFE
jgi:T5SS/PEP-CTERM-associated repeat protein